MGFGIAKAMLVLQLSVLLMNCFTVFGEVIETITPAPAPKHSPYHNHNPVAAPTQPPSHHHHHHHPQPHPPTVSPAHPPSHKSLPPAHSPGHHHHHHHPHSPSPTPSPSHPPVHPPSHTPVHPPSHTQPPSHTPVHPPSHTQPPSHTPAHPPSHTPAHPPSHTPAHPPITPIPRSFVAVQGVVYCKSCKYAGVNTLLNATAVLGATVKLQCNNTKYPLVLTTKTDKNGYFFITAPKTITTYGVHKCKASLISSPVDTCNKPSDLHYGITGAVLRPQKPFMSEKLPFFLYNVGPFAFEPTCHY